MKLNHLVLLGGVALGLAACSDASNAQSPEEIVAFMVVGLRDKDSQKTDQAELHIEKKADRPMVLRLSGSGEKNGKSLALDLFDIVTSKQSDCVYTVELKTLASQVNLAPFKLIVDFEGLKSAKVAGREGAIFEGATFACPADAFDCELLDLEKAGHWGKRIGNDFSKKTAAELQAELDEAVMYFRQNVCKGS